MPNNNNTEFKTMHYFTAYVEEFKFKTDEGTIYVSSNLAHTLHHCPCGCGQHVALPINADGWTMTQDNNAVTITPSIRNSRCGSHYYIRRNMVVPA